MVMCCAMLRGGIATQKSCSRPSRRCNTNQRTWGCRAGGAVCCWVHVDENLWRLPMLFTMWIPDSGSVWSNLDERNFLSLSDKMRSGIITSEIHRPLMQCIVWYVSKRKPINFQSAPPKKHLNLVASCCFLIHCVCVIVRCFQQH